MLFKSEKGIWLKSIAAPATVNDDDPQIPLLIGEGEVRVIHKPGDLHKYKLSEGNELF